MASSVIQISSLPAGAGASSSVGSAFGEVAIAFKHLASALVRNTFSPATAVNQTLTAFEEAESLRSFAADMQDRDPGFAQDLFAAADRHEIEAAALAANATR